MFDIRKLLKPDGFGKEKSGGEKRLSPKQAKLLLIGGPILAVSLILIFTIVLNTQETVGTDGADSPGSAESLLPDEQDGENDLFANAIMTGEFADTVLGKTADAGAEYAKETLFIGDSNTAGMLNYSNITNVTMNNGIGIVSMGISHVTNLKCVKFQGMAAVTVPEAVKIMQPRRIVITYGTNDYYMTPEKFAETYKNSLEAIETAYPYSDIIIGSIFPITSNCSYYTVSMPTIEKFNLELVKLAQEKGVHFLNWSEALKDPATGFCKSEYMSGDGVHLSKKGMEQISDYFRTHKLDSEDKRPKPLNPVPVREATPPGLLGSGPRTPVSEPEPVIDEDPVSVIFTAAAGGSVNGSQSFSVNAVPGATVSATATANPGYVFVGWTGAAGSSGPTISFTIPLGAGPGETFVLTAMFELAALPPADPPKDPPVDPPPADPPTDPPVDPPADPPTDPPE